MMVDGTQMSPPGLFACVCLPALRLPHRHQHMSQLMQSFAAPSLMLIIRPQQPPKVCSSHLDT